VTALLTPGLALAAGDKPSRNVWLGCLVALAGTTLLSLDTAPNVAVPSNASHIAIGEPQLEVSCDALRSMCSLLIEKIMDVV
jgi:hypothetical protein